MDGSNLPRFKRAFIAALQARAPHVHYQSPSSPEDMLGEDGSGVACWFGDDARGEFEPPVMAGADKLWLDERWVVPFRVQALGTDTDATQEVVDQLAVELLGQAMWLFHKPSFELEQTATLQFFHGIPTGQAVTEWTGGFLPTGFRAARFELGVEVYGRLILEGS
jgi:hypothetical protein